MTISRLTIPENFFDTTSSMLLLQPQPQFLFASLWKRAMAASLTVPMALGVNGREIQSNGGSYQSASAGRLTIADDLFDGLFAAKFDMKGQSGHMVRVNRPKFALTTYTKASRKITAGTSISTTAIAIGSEQNNITIARYAGPYDSTNSRVAPFALDKLDASMGVHSLVQAAGAHLQEDFDRFHENVMVTLANTAANTIRPVGISADNDVTATGQAKLDYNALNRAEAAADEANLPVFADGYRLLCLTPTQLMQLKDDSQFARYAQHHQQYNALFPGYVTSINRMHVFKCTTLDQAVNSSSIAIHKGLLLSPGAFMAAMGEPPRVASSTDDNYGETAKVIWIGYFETELADNRFAISVRSSA